MLFVGDTNSLDSCGTKESPLSIKNISLTESVLTLSITTPVPSVVNQTPTVQIIELPDTSLCYTVCTSTVDFSWSPDSGSCVPGVNDSIDFTNHSVSTGTVTYSWDFGVFANRQFSSLSDPAGIVFSQVGFHPVTLVVTDDCGVDSITLNVEVFTAYLIVTGCQNNPGRVKRNTSV